MFPAILYRLRAPGHLVSFTRSYYILYGTQNPYKVHVQKKAHRWSMTKKKLYTSTFQARPDFGGGGAKNIFQHPDFFSARNLQQMFSDEFGHPLRPHTRPRHPNPPPPEPPTNAQQNNGGGRNCVEVGRGCRGGGGVRGAEMLRVPST